MLQAFEPYFVKNSNWRLMLFLDEEMCTFKPPFFYPTLGRIVERLLKIAFERGKATAAQPEVVSPYRLTGNIYFVIVKCPSYTVFKVKRK